MKRYVHPQDRTRKEEAALLKDVQLLHARMKRFDDKHYDMFERWEREALQEATRLIGRIVEEREPRKPFEVGQ